MNYNSYRCAGVLYDIGEVEFTKKSGYPKLKFHVEVPTIASMAQKTEIFEFLIMGDDANGFDTYYEKGDWVELLFRIEGRFWTPPDDPDKNIYLSSLRPIDIHKGENPFETGKELVSSTKELSSDPIQELTKNVRDYSENNKDPFEEQQNDLPF